tara:strand:- start:3 stop:248 length:246 start_codon:yes stop_codon:yes gene_type:complete
MKLTQEMIDKIQELMNHTKKDGSENWVDGDEIKISLAGTFAADKFIVIGNESKKPWVPAAPHPRFDYEKGEFIKDEDSDNN